MVTLKAAQPAPADDAEEVAAAAAAAAAAVVLGAQVVLVAAIGLALAPDMAFAEEAAALATAVEQPVLVTGKASAASAARQPGSTQILALGSTPDLTSHPAAADPAGPEPRATAPSAGEEATTYSRLWRQPLRFPS